MSTAKMPLSATRAALIIALAALLVWAAMRMVIGLAVAVPAVSSAHHQGSPIAAPAAPAAAPQDQPAPSVGSAPSSAGTSVHQTTPAQQPSNGCLLTGTNVPSKSYVRGGCPAQ